MSKEKELHDAFKASVAECERIGELLITANRKRAEAFEEYAAVKWGVKVGSLVDVKKGGWKEPDTTERFQVTSVSEGYGRSLKLEGRVLKKDGTPGTQIRSIYRDWKVAE